jgi:uncharacterized protein
MDTAPTSVAEGDNRRRARRGLAVFFAIVVPLSAIIQAILVTTGNPLWVFALMWSVALASVVTRLALREGFADVSFRFGGARTWRYLALAPVVPLAIGLIAYGIAWTTGLARFDPQPVGLVPTLVGENASPVTIFLVILAWAATIGTITAAVSAAGEEIGWRGYMLTRLIDAGVPRPILVSGVIWGLWHVPLILGGILYADSPSPVLAAALFVVSATSFAYVLSRMRLETGSIWPVIALHAAYNSIIQTAFAPVTTGAGAPLWVGMEAGILVVLATVVVAVIFSRGTWTYVRRPPERGEPLSQRLPQKPARVR